MENPNKMFEAAKVPARGFITQEFKEGMSNLEKCLRILAAVVTAQEKVIESVLEEDPGVIFAGKQIFAMVVEDVAHDMFVEMFPNDKLTFSKEELQAAAERKQRRPEQN